MLFDLESYALSRQIHKIRLEPLNPSLIPYYKDNGYDFDSETKIDESKLRKFMFKNTGPFYILEKKITNINTNKKLRKTMKIKKVS
jgi:hypothetical protein